MCLYDSFIKIAHFLLYMVQFFIFKYGLSFTMDATLVDMPSILFDVIMFVVKKYKINLENP
jgi:hypothetical protein